MDSAESLLPGAAISRASQKEANRFIDRLATVSLIARGRGFQTPLAWYPDREQWDAAAAAVIAAAVASGHQPPTGWCPKGGPDLPAAAILGRPTIYVGGSASDLLQRLQAAARSSGIRKHVPYVVRLVPPKSAGALLALARAALRSAARATKETVYDLQAACYHAALAAPRDSVEEHLWCRLEKALFEYRCAS